MGFYQISSLFIKKTATHKMSGSFCIYIKKFIS